MRRTCRDLVQYPLLARRAEIGSLIVDTVPGGQAGAVPLPEYVLLDPGGVILSVSQEATLLLARVPSAELRHLKDALR